MTSRRIEMCTQNKEKETETNGNHSSSSMRSKVSKREQKKHLEKSYNN